MSGYDPNRLAELVSLLLDEGISAEEMADLNAILRGSELARAQYRRSSRIHAALIRNRGMEISGAGLPAKKGSFPRSLPFVGLAAAACIGLGFWAVSRTPVARLSGTVSAEWGIGSDLVETLVGKPLDLKSGFAEITFKSGVQVILEGPCRFQITSKDAMNVSHGRASVKVPKRIDGFHLDTPGGRITDLGTEFGVAVGSGTAGPVVLTEVFDGEIEIPAEDEARKRLLSGDSLAIVRDSGGTRLISLLDDYRVNLRDSARKLPPQRAGVSSSGNLALGKPVMSPSYYIKEHGSVFPPEKLTDGRLNDTGSPGDWSFWLAPNGDSGEFTVDLGELLAINRIELQNTRNRTHGDRGLRKFTALVSEDGKAFREIHSGELQRIADLPSPGFDFPFESFTFEPVRARFVKILAHSHYQLPDRPADNPNHGGGLNEIRVFGP